MRRLFDVFGVAVWGIHPFFGNIARYFNKCLTNSNKQSIGPIFLLSSQLGMPDDQSNHKINEMRAMKQRHLRMLVDTQLCYINNSIDLPNGCFGGISYDFIKTMYSYF